MVRSFGEALRKAREEKGLSLRETAKRANISHPYLSQLENEKATQPSKMVISKLASVLEVPYAYFDYFADEDYDPDSLLADLIPRILKNIDIYRWLEKVDNAREFERLSIENGALKEDHGLEEDELRIMMNILKNAVKQYDLLERGLSLRKTVADASLSRLKEWPDTGIEIEELLEAAGGNILYKGQPLTEKDRKKILAIAEILLDAGDEEGDNEH